MRDRRPRWARRLALLLSLGGMACNSRARDTQVLEWVRAKDLPPGSTHTLALPDELTRASADARVYAARLADGRLCILLKKAIRWKENFDGVLQCDGALRPAEIIARPQQRTYVALPGHAAFEELYVKDRRNERTIEVFFDLN